MVGSRSRAGMIGFLAGLILLLVLLRKVILNNWKRVLIILFAFLLIFTSMGVYSLNDLLGDIIAPKSETELVEEELIYPPITNVKSNDNEIILETSEVHLNIVLENDSINFYDKNDYIINSYFDNKIERNVLIGDKFSDHSFKQINDNEFIWYYYNKEAHFKYNNDRFYMKGMRNEFYEIEEVSAFGFEGYERLGSSRGYIWSRTFPMLSDTIITGHGPDTYAMYFPQEDVIGKLKFLRSSEIIVDKPHNLYLQIGINTGIISLIALLVLWGAYFIDGINLYYKSNYNKWSEKVGVSVLAAVIAYLAAGMFNDSVVSVAPVFWILLGIGISMNLKLKSKN